MESEELASHIKDTFNDRIRTGTVDLLALETATLKGHVLLTLDTLSHYSEHLRKGEIYGPEQMQQMLDILTTRLTNAMLNLEDVRLELIRKRKP